MLAPHTPGRAAQLHISGGEGKRGLGRAPTEQRGARLDHGAQGFGR